MTFVVSTEHKTLRNLEINMIKDNFKKLADAFGNTLNIFIKIAEDNIIPTLNNIAQSVDCFCDDRMISCGLGIKYRLISNIFREDRRSINKPSLIKIDYIIRNFILKTTRSTKQPLRNKSWKGKR